jgi:hypothetical protein
VAVGITSEVDTNSKITPALFYEKVNGVFSEYNLEHRNFLTYLVDGPMHCFTPLDVYYKADAKGPEDDGTTNNYEMMYTWYNCY